MRWRKTALTRALVVGAALLSWWGMATLPARAATVSSSDLQLFHQVAASDTSVVTFRTDPVTAKFSTIFPLLNGEQYSDVGTITNINYDPTGDMFELNVFNNNENPWDFSLILNGVEYALSKTTIVNGTSAILSVALSGGTGFITSVAVRVAGLLPLGDPLHPSATGYPDRNAEYSISAVPIPPALFLFGTGMVGLGLLTHRRKHKFRPRSVSLG
jgi:hypothetical protein